ncbi:MAG: acyl-CoA dehydrogenase family protein, partial [Anaerolineales bacterium]
CILMEELNRACPSTATIVGAHIGIAAMSLYLDGSSELKQKYLPDLCSGRKIASFALTEPGAGSDAAGIQMRATLEGDSYYLDGQKMWITNGPIADVIMVLAVTDPALGARGGATVFVVEKAWDGFQSGKPEHKMGLHGSPTSLLTFDEVRVPKENILGQTGLGFVTFMKTLDIGRVSLGAATLGGAQAALEASLRWVKARSQFGRPIANMQSIQFMLADMACEIEALRSLVYRTAWLVDTGQPFIKEAGMCKLYGSEVASRCIDRALQIHGALGYSRDFPLERGWRDSRISEIFEGTNEIQRIVIASELLQAIGVRIRP